MIRQKQQAKAPCPLPILVRRRPGAKYWGVMQIGNLRLRCALGRSGISAFKREGDGATPLASLPILSGFCTSPIPRRNYCPVPLKITRPQDGWCDASQDANYNKPVRLPYHASAEMMRRDDGLYNIGFVLDWNISSRCLGRGSAIFLHLARQGKGGDLLPTQGCIALTQRDMARLLPHLKPGRKIIMQS